MAKSMLTTINQVMSIASKAHYMNGGNASKILAKDKKGIFTIDQVAETLGCDPNELKQVLQQNKIMCSDYVIVEEWGDGTKLSTFALRTLNDAMNQQEKKSFSMVWFWVVLFVMWLFFGVYGVGITFIIAGWVWLCKQLNKADNKYKQTQEEMQQQLPEDHKAKGMM